MTGLKQPNVSNHLARMRARNVLRGKKSGREVYYHFADSEIEAIVCAAFANQQEGQRHELQLDEIALRYAQFAIEGNDSECGDLLETAFSAGLPLLDVYQDILTPAMALVGQWYSDGSIDEAQEHLASGITERMMARTVQVTGPRRRLGEIALLGTAPNAWHVIGLRMIADYLRYCGWKTYYLGANVPCASFEAAVARLKPRLVLFSCASEIGADDTIRLIRSIRAQNGEESPVIGVGGAFAVENSRVFRTAGASFVCETLRQFATDHLPRIEARELDSFSQVA